MFSFWALPSGWNWRPTPHPRPVEDAPSRPITSLPVGGTPQRDRYAVLVWSIAKRASARGRLKPPDWIATR